MDRPDRFGRVQPRKGLILSEESTFNFDCRPGIACFTKCCRRVNIFLTPLDIVRLKNRLGISSDEFLKKYTTTIMSESSGLPVVVLKLSEDGEQKCPFVTEQGCSVYEDRPWPCRMYPLDKHEGSRTFYYFIDNPECLGFKEDRKWTVKEWEEDQGIYEYREYDYLLFDILAVEKCLDEKIDNEKIIDMYYMACYDIDRFKRFVFGSRFLDIFDIPDETVEKIKTDDRELLKLALKWLKFGMVGGKSLKIKEEVLEAARKKQESEEKEKVKES